MSYDLFFRARAPRVTITPEEFDGYFVGRPCYSVSHLQAWCSNDETGVYFVFEYDTRDDIADKDDEENSIDPSLLPVSFNLNYFRPHPFGLEVEPEVRAFVEHFDLLVSDLQTFGMGDGEYSTDGFLRGWNAGNEFGYSAIAGREPNVIGPSLSGARIESVWRWNNQRKARQERVGSSVFVPKIFFFSCDGHVATGVVWADGIPILLPEVDLLLVPREQLARRRLFRSPKNDIVVLDWEDIVPILCDFRESPGDPRCFELFYEKTPADIELLIRRANPPVEMPEGVSFDQVLNQELLDAARRPSN